MYLSSLPHTIFLLLTLQVFFFSIFNFFYPIPLYFFSQLVFLINNIALIMKKKDKKNCRKNEQKKIYKS
jgi:hypothetical protein